MDVFLGVMCSVLALALVYVLPIVALVSNVRAKRRIEVLERRIGELEALGVGRAAAEGSSSWGGALPRNAPPGGEAPRTPRVALEPAPAGGPTQPTPLVPPAELPSAVPAPAEPPPAKPPPAEPPLAASPPAAPAPAEPPPAEPPPPATPPAAKAPPPPAPPKKPLGADAIGVWILAVPGGLALLLAAIFALREAIAAGLVGPGVRFALGAAVGAFALLASEFARSRRYDVPAAALGGGGAGIVYAVIYAGHARYGLIGQELAFALMVVTTAVTLFAAERRDSRFMASLALAGGYLTPILLSTGENKAVAFFGYLALLDAGLLVAATRRRWTTLIAIAAVATTALYLGWVVSFHAPDQVAVGLAAPALLGGLFLALPARRSTATSEAVAGGLGALLLLLAALAYVIPADPLRRDPVSSLPLATPPGDAPWIALVFLVLAPGAALLVGRRRDALWLEVGAVAVGSALLAAFTLGWSFVDTPPWPAVALALLAVPLVAALSGTVAWALPLAAAGALLTTVALGGEPPFALLAHTTALLAVLGAVVGNRRGPRPALIVALLATAAPLLAPLAHDYVPANAGDWFLATAVVYAAFAFPPFWRPRAGDLFGALSAALAGPALFFAFHRLWIETLGDDLIGVLPVLLGIGTLLAAITLVRAVKVRADDRELAILVTVVLLFAAGAVPLQLEEAWLTLGWALEVALLGALSRRLTHPGIRVFAGALALAVCVRLLLNPDALSYGGGEGWIVLNWTLYTWGVPAVCLLVAARLFDTPTWFRTALRVASVLLFFALVNLEVAHAFAHDDVLSFSSEDLAESMTRSIAWAVYGLVLIAVGTVRDSRGARLAGLAFAMLGALKVFTVDLWHLSGFARVGAFGGLAITLLVGAIAFQRIVLKDRKP